MFLRTKIDTLRVSITVSIGGIYWYWVIIVIMYNIYIIDIARNA